LSKSSKNRERREVVEQMRKEAKAAERRRTMGVLAVCVVVALIIIGVAGYTVWQDNKDSEAAAAQSFDELGQSAKQAGCVPATEHEATGSGDHVTSGVDYETTPPDSGPHNPSTAPADVHFYDVGERPDVELLVHNLEHGWTIVWYDETVADDDQQMKALQTAADKLDQAGNDPRANVIIAPWTSDDGDPIPDGKHIAFTHWSVHKPADVTPTRANVPDTSYGASQYCTTFSGAALDSFRDKYPYDDAPEGYLWHE
jgi:cytoskeletal protein RodZ